ncbi:MAG TPA: anti-sigma factor, partial [Candidatus Manganitrophaceae bacterium]
MDELEGETQVGGMDEVGAQKTIPGKESLKKPAGRVSSPLLVFLLFIVLIAVGGFYYLQSQQRMEEMRVTVDSLKKEAEAKTRTIAKLTSDLKNKEEGLQQANAEGERWKGEAETMRLALAQKDSEMAELKHMAAMKSRLPKNVQALQSKLAQKEIEIARLQKAGAEHVEWLRLLSSSTAHLIRLTPSKEGGKAAGVLLFDPGKPGALFFGHNLPKLPAGKTYQLWAIKDRPTSMGTFQPMGDQTGVVKAQKAGGLEGMKQFAVTVEPAGGRFQPSGPTYLLGAVAGV